MVRAWAYAEALTEVSSTSSTRATMVTATIDTVSGRSYAIIWGALGATSDSASVLNLAPRNITDGVEIVRARFAASSTSEYAWLGAAAIYTAGSSATRTFGITYRREAGTGTVYAKNCRLLILELDDADVWAADGANQVTTATFPTDGLVCNFTPDSEGDYLFLACANVANGGNTIDFLTPASTSINQLVDDIRLSTSYIAWSAMWRETVPASASTAKIRWGRASGTGNLNFDDACIIGLRLDRLIGAQSTQTSTPSAGTDTSYTQTQLLQATSLDPVDRPTFLLAFANLRADSNANLSYGEVREDTTSLTEGKHFETPSGRGSLSMLMPYRVTANDNAIDFDFRRKSDTAITTSITTSALAVIELPYKVDISGNSAGTATVTGDLNGQGRLSGASAGSATATGDLNGTGDLAGTSAGDATATGHLLGAGALVGTGAGTSTGAGTLTGAGRLSGASAGAATATGSLVADGALAGTAAGTSTASGQLLGVGALSGAAAGTSTATGSLVAILPASGTAAGTSTATGTISGAGALIGVASGAATVSGDLNGDGDLAGTAAGTSTATGHVADAGSLRGSAHGSSAASGALSEGRTLGEILAAWGIRNGWQPPGAAVALGKLRGRAAGGSSATGKIAGLQPKTRRPRQAAPAPTARKASPARPSPARKPQIDRLIPMPGPLSGRAIGRHVVATGAVVGIGALAGTAAGAEGASVGTLKAIAEARGTGRGQGAARGAVAAIYGDTLDDEEALAMILAAA